MKKIVSLLFVGMLVLSSLMAFAGGGDGYEDVIAPAENEIAPSQVVSPLIDCDHTYGTTKRHIKEQTECFKYVEYDEISCAECGTLLRTTNTKYGSNDEHTGGLRYSDIYKKNGYWYKDVYCKGCGEFLGSNIYDY